MSLFNVQKIQKQLTWLIEQVRCLKLEMNTGGLYSIGALEVTLPQLEAQTNNALQKAALEINAMPNLTLTGDLAVFFKTFIGEDSYTITFNNKKFLGDIGQGSGTTIQAEDLMLISSIQDIDVEQILENLKYTNTDIVPVTLGGYVAGQPATPEDGLDIQQAIDKFLFPAVNPTISSFSASPQPEFNQPTPYNINVSWNITINTVGADIDTLTLEWRRGTSGAFTALAVNNNDTSFVHQITSVSNVNIQYRLTVVDTQGASQSTTITRNIENYAAPTGSLTKIPSPNIIERGVNTTLNGSVTRNRQHAIISNVKFQKRINNGSWITEEEFDSVDLGTLINITEFISNNGNNDSKVYFRLLVTDNGNSNDNQIAYTSTDLILPYFYGKSSSAITPNQGLFDDVNTSKVLASSEGTVSIVFDASAEFLWVATPESSTTKTNWFVTAFNAGDIGGITNLWESPITLNIVSPDGLWTQNYKIYVTNRATSTANGVAMELRN